MNGIQPLVSVFCPTYNHEKYIAQAIEGFLMQKVNFPIEIIIHDDASTDKTAQVIKEYETKYPQLFKCLYQSENQLSKDRSYLIKTCFRIARGTYIALCEGDDFWTDPYKLQKQVDFLEANKDFAICFHNMKVIYDDGRETHLSNPPDQKEVTTIEDLADGNYIYTGSCVFRNGLIKEFPGWYNSSPVGDYVLHMLNAQHGRIKFLPDIMGVYRVHKGGLWGNKNYETMLPIWIKLQDNLIGMFSSEINNLILNSQLNNIITYYQLIKESGDKNMFEDYFPKCFSSLPVLVIDYKEEIERLNSLISKYKSSTSYRIGNLLVKPFKNIFK
jgi:glycosyltransferase involved in cell wall biosynthesis